jgi:tRNA dimethylallyltransferase
VSGPLLCIMGPTASGKTDLAVALAEALDGELISVDSALVYRDLDIGSAKSVYPHHLIDICDPAEVYSAARFARDARSAIEAIRQRGRRPILVGGTMLYYRALLRGLAPMPAADPALRADLEARATREGWPALHAELVRVDPVSAARIHPNHSQRIVRALELCRLTGRPASAIHGETPDPALPSLCVALAPADRATLHARIATRLQGMLANGFVEEVAALRARGDLHPGLPSMRAVGYRQIWEYLDGSIDRDRAVERTLAATRQLAKRQLTWLRSWPQLSWLLTDAGGHLLTADGALAAVPGALPSDRILNYLGEDAMV